MRVIERHSHGGVHEREHSCNQTDLRIVEPEFDADRLRQRPGDLAIERHRRALPRHRQRMCESPFNRVPKRRSECDHSGMSSILAIAVKPNARDALSD